MPLMKYVSNQSPGFTQEKFSIVTGGDSGCILAAMLQYR